MIAHHLATKRQEVAGDALGLSGFRQFVSHVAEVREDGVYEFVLARFGLGVHAGGCPGWRPPLRKRLASMKAQPKDEKKTVRIFDWTRSNEDGANSSAGRHYIFLGSLMSVTSTLIRMLDGVRTSLNSAEKQG